MKKRNLSKNSIVSIWNAARFVSYILAILLTPLLALPLAMLFDPVVSDWWRHGELRVFYQGLITGFLWLGEIIGFYFLDKHLQKKYNLQIDTVKEENAQSVAKDGEQTQASSQQTPSTQKQTEEAAEEVAVAISAEATQAKTTQAEATEISAEKAEETKDFNARKDALGLHTSLNARAKGKTELLPMKNVIAVFLICAACVLLISAQIGFEVKVFYELGERITLSEVVNFSGTAGGNIAKCGWIVLLIKASFGIFEGIFEKASCQPKAKKAYIYLCATLLVLAFGVYDVIVSQNPFWWTYLLFYVAFVAIYALVRRAPIKSYLLILFIYFF